jgi:D-xylose transport system substrate-binding protein
MAVLAVLALSVGATACGGSKASVRTSTGPTERIAFFLPHAGADRYEAMDQPYFTLRFKRLCPTCEVDYRNAGNKQDVQTQQVQDALDKGAKVLVVDAVDSGHATAITDLAKSRHVPVISYDRLILGASLDYYISFDNVAIGQLAGNALLQAMGPKAATGSILWVNGPPATTTPCCTSRARTRRWTERSRSRPNSRCPARPTTRAPSPRGSKTSSRPWT